MQALYDAVDKQRTGGVEQDIHQMEVPGGVAGDQVIEGERKQEQRVVVPVEAGGEDGLQLRYAEVLHHGVVQHVQGVVPVQKGSEDRWKKKKKRQQHDQQWKKAFDVAGSRFRGRLWCLFTGCFLGTGHDQDSGSNKVFWVRGGILPR